VDQYTISGEYEKRQRAIYHTGHSVLQVSLISFGAYALSREENVLNAQVAFVSLSLFDVMKFSMEVLPEVVTNIVQVRFSTQ
jgi:hypothetical protein